MKRIIIHSITVRADIIDPDDASKDAQYARTFERDEKNLPGLIMEMFSNARRFIFYNVIDREEPKKV